MPSSCSRRTRRTRARRSHGGSAELNEAFADLKGDVKPPAAPPAPPAPPAAPPAPQMGGRRNRRTRRSRGSGVFNVLTGAVTGAKGAVSNVVTGAKGAVSNAVTGAKDAVNSLQKVGGRRKSRKSRKLSKGATAWTTAVTKLYREMKAKDKSAKFSDALKRASVLKKKGQL